MLDWEGSSGSLKARIAGEEAALLPSDSMLTSFHSMGMKSREEGWRFGFGDQL